MYVHVAARTHTNAILELFGLVEVTGNWTSYRFYDESGDFPDDSL